MVILLIVVALIPPILLAVSSSTSDSNSISAGTAQARLAVENLSAQVASSSEVCLPTTLPNGSSVQAGFSLLVLSDAFGKSQWDQWMVTQPAGYTKPVLEEQRWPAPVTTTDLTTSMKSHVAASISSRVMSEHKTPPPLVTSSPARGVSANAAMHPRIAAKSSTVTYDGNNATGAAIRWASPATSAAASPPSAPASRIPSTWKRPRNSGTPSRSARALADAR